jgi:nitrogen-specific signal transduction histidine kinase
MVQAAQNLSLSDLLLQSRGEMAVDTLPAARRASQRGAEAEWQAAIAALTQLLATLPRPTQAKEADPAQKLGLVLSGPLPVITAATLMERFTPWVVTPQPLAEALNGQRSLLPAAHTETTPALPPIQALPLSIADPLLTERFCLVVTATFRLALVLGQPTGSGWACQYSFDPTVVNTLVQRVTAAVVAVGSPHITPLLQHLSTYPSTPPDYRLVAQFSQGMVAHLPHRNHPETQLEVINVPGGGLRLAHWHTVSEPRQSSHGQTAMAWTSEAAVPHPGPDAELLQAMAHEIRTPLTTIRTLTRSLLRRQDVGGAIAKRLQRIDQECTQQIDRFNLIFRAAELASSNRDRLQCPLAPIALAQVFQEAVPQWQQQAYRRNLDLKVTLPPQLPRVNSDPTLLHQVLTGVVEWFTQGLPAQSQVQMQVTLAGHQLKLQFAAEAGGAGTKAEQNGSRLQTRSLGQLLTVAPDTGGVSLNLDVTKTLFQALGGKLIVRQRPQQGEVLTVFLPLETREV